MTTPGPLVGAYSGLAALRRAGIAALPTPVDALDPVPFRALRLDVKRDDRSAPGYGGNKVRKLDFLLGRALADGCRSVLTCGAFGSNHALATALHARALGLTPHVVLTPQAPTPYAKGTLLAHAALSTGLHPVDGHDVFRETARLRAELASRDGVEPLVVPMGGSSGLGAVGFVEAAFEALEQVRPDVVYVAGGTLGTAVGLALGFRAAGSPTRVVAVRVTPATVANEAIAARLTADTVRVLREADPTFPRLDRDDLALGLRHDYFEPGYAEVTPAARDAVVAASRLGLRLETTYTGRAFAALLRDAADGALEGCRVLFWQTYHAAPLPPAGPSERLPEALRAYLGECERRFGSGGDSPAGTGA